MEKKPIEQCEVNNIVTALTEIWLKWLNMDYFKSQFEIINNDIWHLKEELWAVKTQTTKTNGRVTKLETWETIRVTKRKERTDTFKLIWYTLTWFVWTWAWLFIIIWYLHSKLM